MPSIIFQIKNEAVGPSVVVRDSVEALRRVNPTVSGKVWDSVSSDVKDAVLEPLYGPGKPLNLQYRELLEILSNEELAEMDSVFRSATYRKVAQILSNRELADLAVQQFIEDIPSLAARLEAIAKVYDLQVSAK